MQRLRLVALAGAAALALGGCAEATTTIASADAVARDAGALDEALAADLLFIIEEEKLAHDVYVALGEVWDARIFANISRAEVQHGRLMADLLDASGLDDPRSSELGVFSDATLQALYDDLVAQGADSWDAAVQAGITIEQTDIADLEATIAGAPNDVRVVLEKLLAGSQRHLEAFTRQA